MNLEELRAFLAVVDTGSFFTAARALKVSRATLRRRIDELEVHAGVPLLDRTRLGATPTQAGALLAAQGRRLVQEAGALLSAIRDVGAEPAGLLRIMLPVGLPPHVLTPLYALVSARYPRLSFRVRYSDNPVDSLLDDVDLALHFGQASPEGPWLSRELMRVPVWLLASRDYLARRGAPRTIEDLAQHDLLAWEMPGEDATSWPGARGGRFPVRCKLLTSEIHWLRQCVINGLGIALVPDVLLPDPGLDPATLVRVLPELIGTEVAVRLVVPTALAEIPKIKALLAMILPFLDAQVPAPRK